MLTQIGMDLVPPALSPDIKGLFEPSQDPTPLTLTETAEFRTINGELIHVLPQQRHEVRKVITHLLTKALPQLMNVNSSPHGAPRSLRL